MKAPSVFSNANILAQMSPAHALGFIVEFSPPHQVIHLHSHSTHPDLHRFIKTDFAGLKQNQTAIDSNTLVLLEVGWLDFCNNQELLNTLACFDIGVVVTRDFPLRTSDLPDFSGFYHFPISENYDAVRWSLDEILIYLYQANQLPRGPKYYAVFDPCWKYAEADDFLTGESDFNTNLNPKLFEKAFSETKKDLRLRRYLLFPLKLQNLPFAVAFFFLKDLPGGVISIWLGCKYAVKLFISGLCKSRVFIVNTKKKITDYWAKYIWTRIKWKWRKTRAARSKAKKLWLEKVYWPVEYHIKTFRRNMTNEEYEAMRTADIQRRTDRKRIALEKRLRKR